MNETCQVHRKGFRRIVDSVMIAGLFVIGLGFALAEGSGRREQIIESLSFASNDTRIAVTKLNARDAQTPFKHYKANVSRTISWLNASDGIATETVQQDFKPGNCGPAINLWWPGRTSVACNPVSGQLAATTFGGGEITIGLGSDHPIVISPGNFADHLAFSKSGRFLAASGYDKTTVWNTESNLEVMSIEQRVFTLPNAALIAFSDDETKLIAGAYSGAHVWDIETAKKVGTIIEGKDLHIKFLAVAMNDTVVVGTSTEVQSYNLSGDIVTSFPATRAYIGCVSASGRFLAFASNSVISVCDLASSQRVLSLPYVGATALALTADGSKLAVGNADGRIVLFDMLTGHSHWDVCPPGRYRWPVTYPIMGGVVWCLLAFCRYKWV